MLYGLEGYGIEPFVFEGTLKDRFTGSFKYEGFYPGFRCGYFDWVEVLNQIAEYPYLLIKEYTLKHKIKALTS